MTHRDELNALSNAEFALWIDHLTEANYQDSKCHRCPADDFCKMALFKEYKTGKPDRRNCAEVIADWLRAEA